VESREKNVNAGTAGIKKRRPEIRPAPREHQTSTVGILRGAMKYIQISAMKYIAGIMVNSTV
jgi:hypothetical protein